MRFSHYDKYGPVYIHKGLRYWRVEDSYFDNVQDAIAYARKVYGDESNGSQAEGEPAVSPSRSGQGSSHLPIGQQAIEPFSPHPRTGEKGAKHPGGMSITKQDLTQYMSKHIWT